MDQLNGNPVVKVLVWVVSHRKVGAHNPFGGTTELEVLDAIFSVNGAWACSVDTPMSYRYETRRMVDVEMYKIDYDRLTSPEAILGWTDYSLEVGSIISQHSEPSALVASAEGKS